MKHIFKISVITILAGTVLTLGIYKVIGSVTGRDAIVIAGIIAGSLTTYIFSQKYGMPCLLPTLISSLLVSATLLGVSLFAANIFEDLANKIWPLSVGFAMLAGSVSGLASGKHLTSGSS